jgi:hypothetical protein
METYQPNYRKITREEAKLFITLGVVKGIQFRRFIKDKNQQYAWSDLAYLIYSLRTTTARKSAVIDGISNYKYEFRIEKE